MTWVDESDAVTVALQPGGTRGANDTVSNDRRMQSRGCSLRGDALAHITLKMPEGIPRKLCLLPGAQSLRGVRQSRKVGPKLG
jgi:hypothetical protein